MRFLVDLCHPGHVHFFRPVLSRLEAEGHEILVTARDKDVAVSLMVAFGIRHEVLSSQGASPFGLYGEYVGRFLALGRRIRRFRPHLLAGIGGIFLAPLGRLTRVPSLVFTDTEHVSIDRYLTFPWATRLCTPEVFRKQAGPRHVRYRGFHELAYLSPRAFEPDPGIFKELGLSPNDKYSIVRFISWQASHDKGAKGLGRDLQEQALALLSRHGAVFISSERELPPEWKRHALPTPPHRAHHVLAQAQLYLGEGATMATEAALVGTPSLYVSSLVGTMGNFEALQQAGLVLSFRDGTAALAAADRLLGDAQAKTAWGQRARDFAAAHVDVADFVYQQMIDLAAAPAGAL